MLVVDTNVLLYAADEASEFHAVCRQRLTELSAQPAPWFLTWSICYEFLRVATHTRVFAHPWTMGSAMRFLEALLAAPGLTVLSATPRHAAVLRQCLDELPEARGNFAHDLHTATLMREHGVSRILTRDADFHRFGFIDVIDPLRNKSGQSRL